MKKATDNQLHEILQGQVHDWSDKQHALSTKFPCLEGCFVPKLMQKTQRQGSQGYQFSKK
jgi:hypothetical protein